MTFPAKYFFSRCLPMLALLACMSYAGVASHGADHLDAPAISIDGRSDINDIYIFNSPSNSDNTVMAMTVNPLAGILSPTTFNPNVAYEFNIDRNNDTRPDLTLVIRFGRVGRDGRQNLVVRYRFGDQEVIAGFGITGEDVALRGGGTLRADLFDDPFFFDLFGFQDGFNFTGEDFFAGFDVSAIVVEMPNERVSRRNSVGLWARTRTNGEQIDRMGRPAINTVVIPSGFKDQFNITEPAEDFLNFGDVAMATITDLSGDAMFAAQITAILLPDVLTFDRSQPSEFLNGRNLADDVIDIELNLLTQGAVPTDGVDQNDVPFLSVFPYLAPPSGGN